jgi:hypothetical protein
MNMPSLVWPGLSKPNWQTKKFDHASNLPPKCRLIAWLPATKGMPLGLTESQPFLPFQRVAVRLPTIP